MKLSLRFLICKTGTRGCYKDPKIYNMLAGLCLVVLHNLVAQTVKDLTEMQEMWV